MVLFRTAILSILFVCAAAGSFSADFKWNFADGDQRVTGDFVQKLVLGNKLRYSGGGIEHYNADGSYYYTQDNKRYTPDGYEFFDDGMRCLNYPNGLRCDMYAVNSKKLILINGMGGRNTAKITK